MSSATPSLAAPLVTPLARPSLGPVRLTRRGRLVVFVGSLLLLVGLVLGLGLALAGSQATGEAGVEPATVTVTVGTGETLWDIAGPLAADGAGGGDVRVVVQDLEELNALDTAMLRAGQELRVPVVE